VVAAGGRRDVGELVELLGRQLDSVSRGRDLPHLGGDAQVVLEVLPVEPRVGLTEAGLEGLVDGLAAVFGEHEVTAERPRGQRRYPADDGGDVGGPREGHHAQPAGVRDRRGQLGNGDHGGADDRLLDPEQRADGRGH
jgi:hypothetical protein